MTREIDAESLRQAIALLPLRYREAVVLCDLEGQSYDEAAALLGLKFARQQNAVQFDALPYEEGRKWELLQGDLIEKPSPTPEHQFMVGNVCASLRQYFQTSPIGAALPDVEFALAARLSKTTDTMILASSPRFYLVGIPDF